MTHSVPALKQPVSHERLPQRSLLLRIEHQPLLLLGERRVTHPRAHDDNHDRHDRPNCGANGNAQCRAELRYAYALPGIHAIAVLSAFDWPSRRGMPMAGGWVPLPASWGVRRELQ